MGYRPSAPEFAHVSIQDPVVERDRRGPWVPALRADALRPG